MNMLYFASLDFYARPNPSFHLMTTMLEDMLEEGHSVYFIGCALEGLARHIPDTLASHPSFKYRLIPVPDTKKSNFVKRYTDGIAYANAAGKYLKEFMPLCDFVFVQSSPTALFNILAARRYAGKKCVIYNVQDMFPGSSIASGALKNKAIASFFYALQKVAYAKSDIIVAISEDMKAKLMEQGVAAEKVEVVVNWFDDRSVSEIPWEENGFAREVGMSRENFYVQYAGTMGYVFEFEKIIRLATLLKERKNIVFQMIGAGSRREEFVAAVKNGGLTNIVFLPLQPQERVSEVYSACDLCLIPLKRGVIGNSVPSKVALLMACKRPILTFTDINSGYARMINDGIGMAFDYEDVDGMARAINELSQDRERVESMGKRGYEFGRELYSRSENMKKYIKIFQKAERNGRGNG